MKKLLALVLALVMTLSLATVSTNAAFADADEISYEEAAGVLSAVGVFVGDGKNFNPKAALNREQAAKLVAYMALGEDVAEALPAVAMFDDVAASSWAAKYIAYCADAGIITGDGAGKFFPTAPVTGYAFTKMLLCALGYEAAAEGFTGGNWEINVAKLAKTLGVSETAIAMNGNLTREQAAQLMLNAIQCKMITGYDNTGSSIEIGDVVINQAWGEAQEGAYYYVDQWDSALYISSTSAQDPFGRNAVEWTYTEEDWTGIFADDTADFVVTKNLTQKEIATMLKGYKLGEYKVNDDTAVSATVSLPKGSYSYTFSGDTIVDGLDQLFADGKVVEIFAGTDKVINQIVVMTYTFEEVTDVDVDSKTGDVDYTFSVSGSYTNTADTTEVVFAAPVAEDDYVTTFYGCDDKLYVYPTTTFTGALTSYTDAGVYTIGGKTYTLSTAANAVSELAIADNNKYWVDQYGFIVKTEGVTTTSTNYAYVLGVDADCTSSFGSFAPAAKVKVLMADGTVAIYDAKFAKKSGNWYVVDADGAVVGAPLSTTPGDADTYISSLLTGNMFSYVVSGTTIALKPVTALTNGTEGTRVVGMYDIGSGNYVAKNDAVIRVDYASGADATMNTKTTFIFWDAEDEEATVVVGNNNLGNKEFGYCTASDVVVGVSETGAITAKYVFVMGEFKNVSNATDKYGYVDFSEYVVTKDGDDTYRTYVMTLADGSEMKVSMKNSFNSGAGLYKYNDDATVGAQYTDYVFEGTCLSFADGVAKFSGAAYTVASDVKVVDLSDEYNTLEDAYVIAVMDEDTQKVIEVAYIFD